MGQVRTPHLDSGTAVQALLDRGWGKAKVEVVNNSAEGSYLDVLRVVNERMLSKRNETQI
jgi:hypothetical protein